MNRKLLISILGSVLIIALSFGIFKMMTAKKAKEPSKLNIASTKYVRVQTITYADNILKLTANGRLNSRNSAEIFSEVQGMLDMSSTSFRIGNSFRKGDILLKLDDEEARLQLNTQKSEYLNLLAMAMPDIKTEFPQSFAKWSRFVEQIDINKPLPSLPDYDAGKEKFFLAARKVLGQYFVIRNLEVKLTKYLIRAPFDGVITASMIEPGTLVRTGQKLGEIAGNGSFELEISVNPQDAGMIGVGSAVEAISQIDGVKYPGSIIRKSSIIDATTQTVKFYANLNGSDLSDGMYMIAKVTGRKIPNSAIIPRKGIYNNEYVFVNDNGILDKKNVNILALSESEAYINGLESGAEILIEPLVNPILGMKIEPVK